MKNYKLKKNGKHYEVEVDTSMVKSRDMFHFNHQLKTRMQVVKDKRYKKPRYKENYLY